MYILDYKELALKLRDGEISENTLWKYFLASVTLTSALGFFLYILFYLIEIIRDSHDVIDDGDIAAWSSATVFFMKQ